MSTFYNMLATVLSSNIPPDQKDLGVTTVASVVITGISVVFMGLIILIALVALYGKIFESVNKKAEEKAKAIAEAEKAELEKKKQAEVKKEAPAVVKSAPPAVEDGVEEEVVAAIMGALSVMYAGSGKKPVLRSVKASKPRRSVWSSAGVMENTRPF